MKIVFISGGWIKLPPEKGGSAELFILSLSRKLASMGHDVIVLDRKYSARDTDKDIVEGVNIVRLKSKRFNSFNFTINFVLSQISFGIQVKKYLNKTRSDVVHVYTSVLGITLIILDRKIRQKIVYTSLGLRRAKNSPGMLDKMALGLEEYLVKRVKKVTIPNEIVREKLINKAKIEPQRVSLVPHIIEIEKFNLHPDLSNVRQKYGLDSKTVVLFVGRICEEKGVEYLVKAAHIISNQIGHKKTRFILVGPAEQFDSAAKTKGHYVDRINKLIIDLGLQEDVIMTGAIHIDDLRSIYAACNIVVVPSLVDLDPMVPVEALASGKPVIGTRVGTIPYRIREGQNGFIIDPGNEEQLAQRIRYLIDNPIEAKKMGSFGNKLVNEEFASNKMADRMLQVFKEVCPPSALDFRCPICGQQINGVPSAKHNGYKLYDCKMCEVMFWDPMKPLEAESYNHYDVMPALSFLKLTPFSWEHSRFLYDSPAKGGRLLEVGCSTGEFLTNAKNAGYCVTGIDYSRGAIEFARSHHGLNEVYQYTIDELISRKPDMKFDVIVFFEVLEHLNSVPIFLNSVKTLLKPGGFVAVAVPNREKWRFPTKEFFKEKWDLPPNHVTRWNIQSLRNLFARHGFSVISSEIESFKAFDHDWNSLISSKLGINSIAEMVCRRIVGQADGSLPTSPRPHLYKAAARFAGLLYFKGFYPVLGLITLPLRILLTKQGNILYLLVSLKNHDDI